MNDNYYTEQTSRTIGSIAIASIFVTQMLLTPAITTQQKDTNITLCRHKAYQPSAIPSTSDQIRSFVTGEYYQGIDSFEATVSDFYAKLISSQELLGIEFEKVLYDNLWKLYES